MGLEQIKQQLAEKDKEFRAAVRWLMEMERFANSHAPNEWSGDEIATIAKETFKEARADVVRTRNNLIEARKALAKEQKGIK